MCVEFAREGFCILGSKCDRLHLSECQEYTKNKKCTKSDECPFIHRHKLTNKTYKSKECKSKQINSHSPSKKFAKTANDQLELINNQVRCFLTRKFVLFYLSFFSNIQKAIKLFFAECKIW